MDFQITKHYLRNINLQSSVSSYKFVTFKEQQCRILLLLALFFFRFPSSTVAIMWVIRT